MSSKSCLKILMFMSYVFHFEVSLTIVFCQFRTFISHISQLKFDSFKTVDNIAKTKLVFSGTPSKRDFRFKRYSVQFPLKNIAP